MRRATSRRASRWIAIALAAVTVATGCRAKQAENDKAEPKDANAPSRLELTPEAVAAAGIVIETAVRRPVDEVLPLSGNLTYDENKVARVAPRIGGRVVRITADLGQVVKSGDILAWIDSPELGEALAAWRKGATLLTVRQRDHERARKLLDGKAISQGEFLSREGEYLTAKAEADYAESRLRLLGIEPAEYAGRDAKAGTSSEFPLRSPIAGRVIDRQIGPGEVLEAGKQLFTIGDLENLWLVARLYEKDIARVHVGQQVEVSAEAYRHEPFTGTIDYVGDQVDPESRTVKARSVIANPTGKLKPGMFVEARIQTSSGEQVLTVPAASVQEIDKQATIFLEVTPNVFEPRVVMLGTSGRTLVEVKKGVAEGQRVAAAGSLSLKAELQKSELGEED